MGEPVIDMYIDGFDYEYKIKKKNVQRKSENSKLIGLQIAGNYHLLWEYYGESSKCHVKKMASGGNILLPLNHDFIKRFLVSRLLINKK